MNSPGEDALVDALQAISRDMHNVSLRLCPTCQDITAVLGEPFGCLAFQAAQEGKNA